MAEENLVLYGKYYTDETNQEKWISVFQGIYQTQSTRGNIIYPSLKYMGAINLTQRYFFKGSKTSRKIVIIEDNSVILFDYHNDIRDNTFTPLPLLFANNNLSEELLNDVTNVVLRVSTDKTIKCFNHNQRHNEPPVDF